MAAIANAIFNATGVREHRSAPENILRALKEAGKAYDINEPRIP